MMSKLMMLGTTAALLSVSMTAQTQMRCGTEYGLPIMAKAISRPPEPMASMPSALTAFAGRLYTLAVYRDRRESEEIYLAGDTEDYNCKIRDDRLEIKERLAVEQGLERWQPRLKASFPLSVELLADELYPALALTACWPGEKCDDLCALFEELSEVESKITVVRVQKQRIDYTLGDCQAEYVRLQIGQASLQSIAVESPDAEQVLAALPLLGLDWFHNTSYPQIIANTDDNSK